MRCRLCKGRFTKQQTRKAVEVYDTEGRLDGVIHFKCSYIAKKHRWISEDGSGRYFKTSPTSWDQIRRTADDLALEERQAEIAEQSALEERPSRFDDWRDPVTLDVEEVTTD